ncbi:hypothetical protein H6G06_18125 [Anabaena sphaerica FACHB-251]|uniref:Uncharacterized protein n=1 Tax=Anabaena sphaerica FACHB-251 TaxID=2692883 RepID=A0A926WIS2_9NOST|nr:hypothetical protein [Anabaena sphaerica]MBD2295336.1 hypothetical protein [Anabaena sphaerica FACHB-251]
MLKEIYDQGVYLHYSQSGEDHLLRCIKEGLIQLDIKICDNPEDSNLNIVDIFDISSQYKNFFDLLPFLHNWQDFKNKSIFANIADFGTKHYISDPEYWLLAAQSTEFINYPSGTRIPWGFGFQQKLLDFTQDYDFYSPRERVILRNFKPSFRQSVRDSLDLLLVPKLEKNIPIDRNTNYNSSYKNNNDFLKKLLASRFCLAYCGDYASNVALNPDLLKFVENSEITYSKNVIILRWDSWRLWESWVMGCIPITLDFKKYGFQLPVMPENWQHYIGLDLGKLEEDVDKLLSLSESQLDEISLNGRKWVIENYSPKAVAERVLTIGIDKVIG